MPTNKDYYAVINVQTVIYFKATNKEKASLVAEEIASDLDVNISRLAPKKYQTIEMEVQDREVIELETQE